MLGELGEDEKRRMEARYLADPDWFEELLTVEDDLLEGYARNEFSQEERERLEKYFLKSVDRYEKVLFLGALSQYVAEHPTRTMSKGSKRWCRALWQRLISLFRTRV
jgi:hypothetical protein